MTEGALLKNLDSPKVASSRAAWAFPSAGFETEDGTVASTILPMYPIESIQVKIIIFLSTSRFIFPYNQNMTREGV